MFSPRTAALMTALLTCMAASAQYTIGHARMELRDESRGNRRVKFEAYYPVTAQAGSAAPSGMTGCKFPVICFAHGYQHPGDQYGNLVNILVPAGYVMLSLTTFEGPLPSHIGYADDRQIRAADADGFSRFVCIQKQHH